MQEHLVDQLNMIDTTPGQAMACEYLIGSLDENGFLPSPLSEIGLLSELPLKDLQDALSILQSFEPVGIAAENLQDCLLKQMEARGLENSLPYRIVKEQFPCSFEGESLSFPENFPNPSRPLILPWKKLPSLTLLLAKGFRKIQTKQLRPMQKLKKWAMNGSFI